VPQVAVQIQDQQFHEVEPDVQVFARDQVDLLDGRPELFDDFQHLVEEHVVLDLGEFLEERNAFVPGFQELLVDGLVVLLGVAEQLLEALDGVVAEFLVLLLVVQLLNQDFDHDFVPEVDLHLLVDAADALEDRTLEFDAVLLAEQDQLADLVLLGAEVLLLEFALDEHLGGEHEDHHTFVEELDFVLLELHEVGVEGLLGLELLVLLPELEQLGKDVVLRLLVLVHQFFDQDTHVESALQQAAVDQPGQIPRYFGTPNLFDVAFLVVVQVDDLVLHDAHQLLDDALLFARILHAVVEILPLGQPDFLQFVGIAVHGVDPPLEV